jgi:predicted Zn finger-like uncharacterized protein
MIVACPKCGKKYQVPEEKLGEGSKRLRCRQCSEVFTVGQPVPPPPEPKPARRDAADEDNITRARRLARVLASDMVVYNKDIVEKARRDGTLTDVMASEIERSWQLWRSRFPSESKERPDLFRDALEDILGGRTGAFDSWRPE